MLSFLGCCCGGGGECCSRVGNAVFRGWPQFVPLPRKGLYTLNDHISRATSGSWDGAGAFAAGDFVQTRYPTDETDNNPQFALHLYLIAKHATSNPPYIFNPPNSPAANGEDWNFFTLRGRSDDFRRAMNDYSGIVDPASDNFPPGTIVRNSSVGWQMRTQDALNKWIGLDFRDWGMPFQPVHGIYQKLEARTTAEFLAGWDGDPGFFHDSGTLDFTFTGGAGAVLQCTGNKIVFVSQAFGQQTILGMPYPLGVNRWPGRSRDYTIEWEVSETRHRYVTVFKNQTGSNIVRVTNECTLGDFISCDAMVNSVTPAGITEVSPGHPCYRDPIGFCGFTTPVQNLTCPVSRQVFGVC